MSETPRLLFVYGTLREDPKHDMYHVLARSAAYIGQGKTRGQLFNLGDYPGLVVSHSEGDLVLGEVYSLSPETYEHALNTLDNYEGLGPNDPLPHEYKRELITVLLDSGATVKAWAYLLTRDTRGLETIPSGDYLAWRRNRSEQ